MSKIKTNPRTIKDCIIAVKHSELSDSKKDTIIQVLKQYQQDKQDGIITDGQIIDLLARCIVNLENGIEVEIVVDLLQSLVDNMKRRKYF